MLRQSILDESTITVMLDDMVGYSAAFLDEVVGGLIRTGFKKYEIDKHLRIVAHSDRLKHHAIRAKQYVAAAAENA